MSVMKHFAMSICMCKKVSVNYGQPVRVFVFFHKTEWVIMIFYDSKSRRTSKLHDRFKSFNNFDAVFFNNKKSNT